MTSTTKTGGRARHVCGESSLLSVAHGLLGLVGMVMEFLVSGAFSTLIPTKEKCENGPQKES